MRVGNSVWLTRSLRNGLPTRIRFTAVASFDTLEAYGRAAARRDTAVSSEIPFAGNALAVPLATRSNTPGVTACMS